MSSVARRKADTLFDEYVTACFAGEAPAVSALLARCPEPERQRLEEAIAGFTFAYDSYACRVDDALVESALERLRRVRLRKQKFAAARLRADALSWEREVTEPLSRMKQLLYPELVPGISDQVSVLHRKTPGISPSLARSLDASLRRAAERFAQSRAECLLSRAGVTAAPVSLEEIAEQLYLLVEEVPLSGLEGCLVTDGETGGILLNSQMRDTRRKRFTLAHEIGHFVLKHASSHKSSSVNERLAGKEEEIFSFRDQEGEVFNPKSREEIEATAFASYLLLPPALLPTTFGREMPCLEAAEAVSEQFDVSLMAVLKRLVQVSNYRTTYLTAEGERIKTFDFSPEMTGYNHVISQLPHGSAAWDLWHEGAVDTFVREVPAGTWFDSGPLSKSGVALIEESRRFETGHIYTLLNVLEDIV